MGSHRFAFQVYHPDKNGQVGGEDWMAICNAITKVFNHRWCSQN